MVMEALHDGIGGAVSDMAGAVLSIPDTALEDVAKAFKLGAPSVDMASVANAFWVSESTRLHNLGGTSEYNSKP